jgi:hypothetical protein
MENHGEFYWPDGSYYIGDYSNDQRHGRGEIFFPNNFGSWKGDWQKGNPLGIGELKKKKLKKTVAE